MEEEECGVEEGGVEEVEEKIDISNKTNDIPNN